MGKTLFDILGDLEETKGNDSGPKPEKEVSQGQLDFFALAADQELPEDPPQRNIFQAGWRQARRAGARTGEAIVGLPGGISQAVIGLGASLPGGDQEPKSFAEDPVGYGLKKTVQALPTTEDLRAAQAELSPELEPESALEAGMDDFIEDVAVLAVPIGGAVSMGRAVGLSAIGNMSKQAVQALGGSEIKQEAAKFGSMLLASLFGKGRGIRSHINRLYNGAHSTLPEGATVRYPMDKLNKVESILGRGSMNEAKQQAMEMVQDIKAKAPDGVMLVEEAIQFDKDINYAIGKSYADKSKHGNLKLVHGAHQEVMDAYGRENKDFGELYKEAKMAHAGIEQSQKIQSYIRKNAKLSNAKNAAVVIGAAEYVAPGVSKVAAAGTAVAATAAYSADMAKRLATNPALRRYYINVVNAALNENPTSLARNMAGLERVAKKEFEDRPDLLEKIDLSSLEDG